jgi:hypothetical protein
LLFVVSSPSLSNENGCVNSCVFEYIWTEWGEHHQFVVEQDAPQLLERGLNKETGGNNHPDQAFWTAKLDVPLNKELVKFEIAFSALVFG